MSNLFKNSNGESFNLKIKGYQFSELENEDDDNWLEIEISVKHASGAWTAQDPCLTTKEFEKLIQWFKSISDDSPREISQDFIEPNLSFLLVDIEDSKYLRIYFELELRPNWNPHGGQLKKDLWIEFQVSTIKWKQVIANLHKQLLQFPHR